MARDDAERCILIAAVDIGVDGCDPFVESRFFVDAATRIDCAGVAVSRARLR